MKRFATDTLRLLYGLEVPKTGKEMLLFHLTNVKTEEELISKGFALQGSLSSWDVYDWISEWENEDGVEIMKIL